MEDSKMDPATIHEAVPPCQRKSISVGKGQRVIRQNLLPDHLTNNEFLETLIDSSLPRNYNFEVPKTIWKIEQTNSRNVILQLPEGLIRFGPILVDIMNGYFYHENQQEVEFIIMGDLTYGACCIDDYLASSIGFDLIVHYAHSCLVPINRLNASVKYLYVFLEISFDQDHLVECIMHNFDSTIHRIALASTVQFLGSIHELAKKLRQSGFSVVLPQSRPLSAGEVLGCTAPKLDPHVNTIVFVCDGRFHLEALMIANPSTRSFRYDPYSRKLTLEAYDFEAMSNQRNESTREVVDIMRKRGTFGCILGTLGRQGSQSVYSHLIERLNKKTDGCIVKFLMPEVVCDILKRVKPIDAWIQVACPRLSIDWGGSFEKPLLNPFELAVALRELNSRNQSVSNFFVDYPMDYYAKASTGNHTPNHSCLNNPDCLCSTE